MSRQIAWEPPSSLSSDLWPTERPRGYAVSWSLQSDSNVSHCWTTVRLSEHVLQTYLRLIFSSWLRWSSRSLFLLGLSEVESVPSIESVDESSQRQKSVIFLTSICTKLVFCRSLWGSVWALMGSSCATIRGLDVITDRIRAVVVLNAIEAKSVFAAYKRQKTDVSFAHWFSGLVKPFSNP